MYKHGTTALAYSRGSNICIVLYSTSNGLLDRSDPTEAVIIQFFMIRISPVYFCVSSMKRSLKYRACDDEENGLQIDRFMVRSHPVRSDEDLKKFIFNKEHDI